VTKSVCMCLCLSVCVCLYVCICLCVCLYVYMYLSVCVSICVVVLKHWLDVTKSIHRQLRSKLTIYQHYLLTYFHFHFYLFLLLARRRRRVISAPLALYWAALLNTCLPSVSVSLCVCLSVCLTFVPQIIVKFCGQVTSKNAAGFLQEKREMPKDVNRCTTLHLV